MKLMIGTFAATIAVLAGLAPLMPDAPSEQRPSQIMKAEPVSQVRPSLSFMCGEFDDGRVYIPCNH